MIELIVSFDDSVKLVELCSFVVEIVVLFDKVFVCFDGSVVWCLLFVISVDEGWFEVMFVGILMGYEFILLIFVLFYVGGYLFKEDVDLFDVVCNFEGEYCFEMFFLFLC